MSKDNLVLQIQTEQREESEEEKTEKKRGIEKQQMNDGWTMMNEG